jgi:hypothetical protein
MSECWYNTERRLRVFQNRVLRRTFGPKSDKINRGMEKNYIMRRLMNYTPHQILFR